MVKKSTQAPPQQAQADNATPETEWPQSGGSYIRNKNTGSLTKSNPVVIPAKAGTQSNTNPAKPDTSEEGSKS